MASSSYRASHETSIYKYIFVFFNFFYVHFCAPRMYATHMLMLYSSTSVWTYTSICIYSMQTYASHAQNCCTCDVCTHANRMHTVPFLPLECTPNECTTAFLHIMQAEKFAGYVYMQFVDRSQKHQGRRAD
jgi:hypothetical protein